MSETAGAIVIQTPMKVDFTRVGTSIKGIDVRIDKPDPNTKEGEIIFRGRCMFMGYYKNE